MADDGMIDATYFSEETETLIALIQKTKRTHEEEQQAKKLVHTLFSEAKNKNSSGEDAALGLSRVAEACTQIGAFETAMAFWDRLLGIGELTENRILYYQAMDAIDALRSSVYDEHHPKRK